MATADPTTTPVPQDSGDSTTNIIVPVVLGSVIVLLLIALIISVCLFLKKRRKLCFGEIDLFEDLKPILRSDRDFGAGKKNPFEKKKRKNKASKPKKKKSKGIKYHPLGAPRFPKSDPFANTFLENPLADEFDNEDWSNPLFDTEQAAQRDAAITIQSWYRMVRVRVPYTELREAVVLCQAMWKGIRLRRQIPQMRREKLLKDQLKRKQAGWRKKGTLSALKFFEVKGFGFAEVEQLYGLETVRNAAEQLKSLYGGKGKMKLKLFISVKGLKLYDFQTFSQFAVVKVSSVSFCTLDPKNKKIFAFINRKKKRNFCHVFQASEHDAQKMVETMAEAFEVTFKRLEEKRESREINRLAELKKRAFHRQSQELDVEVASMMEMAETASQSTGSDHMERRSMPQDNRRNSPAGSLEGSITGSRERLIPSGHENHRSKGSSNRSSLAISQRASHLDYNPPMFTQPLPQQTRESTTNSLTRERRQVEVDIENHRLNSTIDRMVHRFT